MSIACTPAILLSALLMFVAVAKPADPGTQARSDVQMRAMLDEMARSRTLQLNDLDKPYFVQFATSDTDQLFITATLGGVVSANRTHFRSPTIEIRVGDPKFDNTNSVFSRAGRIGVVTLDEDYAALRTSFWLASDALYKAAVDQISRKRNAVREIAEPDTTPDLAPVKAVEMIEAPPRLDIDENQWKEIVRQASERFANDPVITESRVQLRAISSTYRVVNTEGTRVRVPQQVSEIAIQASALAPDGSRVWNHRFITVLSANELPGATEVEKAAQEVGEQTEAEAKAPVGEDYSGPVLFEHEAAAQVIAQMLTDAVRLQRKPMAPPGAAPQMLNGVWSSRLGSKVAPDWLTIIDNPSEQKYGQIPLAGYYQVDDQGVPGEQVVLVDKGTLRSYLLSREPVRQFAASNGHGRLPGPFGSEQAVIGNLFVQAEKTIPEADLKARLLSEVKTAGLKYGMLIRRIDFPATANLEQLQNMARQLQKNGYARTVGEPLLAYRVYLDGREELVRGLRFGEFSAKDLRDLDSASNQPYVFNYLNNGSSLNLADSGSDLTSSSVICPSLLFESVDLLRSEDELGKLPIVPAPELIH